MTNPDPVDPLRPRKPGGMRAGAAAAVLAHLVLIGAITLAVNWRSSTPEGVTAELWAATPQEAAPRGEPPPPPPPEPSPAPAPAPAPKPEPAPAPAPPPPQRDTRAERDAQIAVEKAKREKEKAEREAEERREKEKAEKLAEAKREKERQQKEKAEQDRREKEQQLAKEQAAKDKAAKEQAAKDKAEREKADKLAEAKREQLRKEQLARMMGQASATGAPDARGTAAQSAGPSASYAGRVIARVRPNIVFTDDAPGNPVAEVEVKAAPDGTILGRRLVKSSGVKSWDDAVLRAIDRTETLPRDLDGRVPSPMIIEFRRGA